MTLHRRTANVAKETYRGFTITTKEFDGPPVKLWNKGQLRYTWQYTWEENGITSIPITATSGYRSEKLAIGFAKSYIGERIAATGDSPDVSPAEGDDVIANAYDLLGVVKPAYRKHHGDD